jgi:hypothetical protein
VAARPATSATLLFGRVDQRERGTQCRRIRSPCGGTGVLGRRVSTRGRIGLPIRSSRWQSLSSTSSTGHRSPGRPTYGLEGSSLTPSVVPRQASQLRAARPPLAARDRPGARASIGSGSRSTTLPSLPRRRRPLKLCARPDRRGHLPDLLEREPVEPVAPVGVGRRVRLRVDPAAAPTARSLSSSAGARTFRADSSNEQPQSPQRTDRAASRAGDTPRPRAAAVLEA